MRYSLSALVLATFTICQVTANPVRHSHQKFHEKRDAEAALEVVEAVNESEADVSKREPGWQDVDFTKLDWANIKITYSVGQTWGEPTSAPAVVAAPVATSVPTAVAAVVEPTLKPVVAAAVTAAPAAAGVNAASLVSGALASLSNVLDAVSHSRLTSMGVAGAGINALSSGGGVWLGSDGAYTNTFVNGASQTVILVVWGAWASWVNVHQPLITVTLAPGAKTVVSFAEGSSGGFTGIYPDTKMSQYGQIYETWGEHTFTREGVVDISREVNMNGHAMEIVGPKCKNTMSQCAFVCNSGETCTTGYSLINCSNGSQGGATYGQFEGADSGGCAWHDDKVALTTTFL